MPYINKKDREELRPVLWPLLKFLRTQPITEGQLNYIITRAAAETAATQIERGLSGYTGINAMIGALECAKLELYRRVAAPYEDRKREENGDV